MAVSTFFVKGVIRLIFRKKVAKNSVIRNGCVITMKEKELYLEYMTKKKHQKKQKLEYVKFEKMQKFYVKWRKQNNGIQRIYRRSNGKNKKLSSG